ncbi:MAG: aldehyde reductase [Gammaproteobacteria bacterium]|nr:aldehyde reductase [Gammaproteobacteria bacterium]
MDKVLVTGATGFIALHCIQQLLDQGYQVKGTVRSEDKKNEVIESMRKNSKHPENLSIVYADLLKDEGWNEAVDGCRYVLHVASPFVLEEPEHEDILIRPAVEGTLRVLNASKNNHVEKVVLTSSFAAIGYGNDEKIFDETDWSNTDSIIGAYAKSKTLAERAAWNFVNELSDHNKFNLTVINPVAVTGPMLSDDIGTSNTLFVQLMDGSIRVCPRIHIGFVDVRDVAKAHIFSMTSEETNGERIIVSEKEMFLAQMARTLKDAGYNNSPTIEIPDLMFKIMATFIKKLSRMKRSVGRKVISDKSKAKELFDWEYITAEDSAIESAKQLEIMGLISN